MRSTMSWHRPIYQYRPVAWKLVHFSCSWHEKMCLRPSETKFLVVRLGTKEYSIFNMMVTMNLCKPNSPRKLHGAEIKNDPDHLKFDF